MLAAISAPFAWGGSWPSLIAESEIAESDHRTRHKELQIARGGIPARNPPSPLYKGEDFIAVLGRMNNVESVFTHWRRRAPWENCGSGASGKIVPDADYGGAGFYTSNWRAG
jgi:hypothetical protein